MGLDYIIYLSLALVAFIFFVSRTYTKRQKHINDHKLEKIAKQKNMDQQNKINAAKTDQQKLEDKERRTKIGLDYEKRVGYQFEQEGYTVEYRGHDLGLYDDGVDLIATKAGEVVLIQCKYWIQPKSVNIKIVREFFGACNLYANENNIKPVMCYLAIPNRKSLTNPAEKKFIKNSTICRYYPCK